MGISSEAIADDRVTDRQREEAKANGQHDEVQHQSLLGRIARQLHQALLRDISLR
jgi:hypothetical protein